jgi:hypothetical protein
MSEWRLVAGGLASDFRPDFGSSIYGSLPKMQLRIERLPTGLGIANTRCC